MRTRLERTAPPLSIVLVAPKAPPYGGMALQAEKVAHLLREEGNAVTYVASNIAFPRGLGFVERLRGIRPFVRSVVLAWRLQAEVRRADVVHVLAASWLYFFLIVAPAVVISQVFHKRVVVNYRSGAGREFFRRYGWLAAPVLRLASAVTAPSQFLADSIQQRFGISVQIVPNILDLTAFRYRPRTHFAPRVLVTRHLEPMYGIDSVIRAFARVQQSYPEALLDVVGAGNQDMNLRQLVADLNLRNVRFWGHVPHSELPAFYDRADILMNGSHVDNFPGSLLEGSAAGLAVVSTNAGGIPTLYENGRTAVLVEREDWEGLANGVLKVLGDPSFGIALTSAAFEICQRCDWRNVRRYLYESYGVSMSPPKRLAVEAMPR